MDILASAVKAVHSRFLAGAALATVLVFGCTPPSPKTELVTTTRTVQRGTLQEELLTMAARDQEYRKRGTDPSLSSEERQRVVVEGGEIDRINTERLKQIVEKHGWPGRRLVGEEGAHAAFTIIQHADDDPAFQKQCLPLLKLASVRGEIKKLHVAYLTDRVRVKLNLPQLYGTQYRVEEDANGRVLVSSEGNVTYLLPTVTDVDGLDDRRKSMGLGPWDEYEKRMAERQARVASPRPLSAPPKTE